MNATANSNAEKLFQTSQGIFKACPQDVLGRGTYGIVYRVTHQHDTNLKKAVKTFSPETMDETEGIPSTTLREINALKSLQHPNVMAAEEVVIPSARPLTDMFVVMELCQGTLKDKVVTLAQQHLYVNGDCPWIQSDPPPLPKAYVNEAKVIAWQLLNALAVVHSRGVMHRDLKPANIMWGFDDLLKLGDFGLARFLRGTQHAGLNGTPQQTGEVQTMWYRAPEVLLGDDKYGLLVDDWSIGCVIAELFRFRKSLSSGRVEPDPLFHGRSDVETLMIIFETLGTPRPQVNVSEHYLAGLRYWSDAFPRWDTGTLRDRVPLLDCTGFNLLQQLLKISPSERQAARFLLDHPWFDDVRSRLTQFVPWYRGLEHQYSRMAAVDRLPLPRTMRALAAEKEERLKAAGTTSAQEPCCTLPPDSMTSLFSKGTQTAVQKCPTEYHKDSPVSQQLLKPSHVSQTAPEMLNSRILSGGNRRRSGIVRLSSLNLEPSHMLESQNGLSSTASTVALTLEHTKQQEPSARIASTPAHQLKSSIESSVYTGRGLRRRRLLLTKGIAKLRSAKTSSSPISTRLNDCVAITQLTSTGAQPRRSRLERPSSANSPNRPIGSIHATKTTVSRRLCRQVTVASKPGSNGEHSHTKIDDFVSVKPTVRVLPV